jgi:hypothetical protein
MAYMLMILEPRDQRRSRSPAEGQRVYDQMLGFAESLKARGVLRAVESLKADHDAVRVEVRRGERKTLDGPFSEAKEMVGGFFLVDCKTRDEAVALAAECPAAEWCTVEVRATGPCYE